MRKWNESKKWDNHSLIRKVFSLMRLPESLLKSSSLRIVMSSFHILCMIQCIWISWWFDTRDAESDMISFIFYFHFTLTLFLNFLYFTLLLLILLCFILLIFLYFILLIFLRFILLIFLYLTYLTSFSLFSCSLTGYAKHCCAILSCMTCAHTSLSLHIFHTQYFFFFSSSVNINKLLTIDQFMRKSGPR